MLNLNPEYYTIWNYRRRVIEQILQNVDPKRSHELLQVDLRFLLPLLIKFPKCYWIWNHRSWLLQECSKRSHHSSAKAIWTQELGLVGKMLTRDNRNFHGWGYRRVVVDELRKFDEAVDPSSQSQTKAPTMTETEFEYTTKMIKTNLSNFSAWHYRSKLIPRLLDERKADDQARRKLFDDDLSLIKSALFTDPYDQSLWFYHQLLMTELCSVKPAFVKFDNADRCAYLEVEIDDIRDLLEDTTDCKLIYQHLLLYASQYVEIEAGNKSFTTLDMRSWLSTLRALDPLREGRWKDLAASLSLE